MPSITIGPVPVRVSQAVAQAANLQNTGSATIYMDTNSAVSPLAYGLAVAPRASVNWASGTELWAVTDGPDTQLSVLYGAEGTTVSEVSAVVTGDVTATIEGPVEAEITGPVTVNGTVNVGNVVQTETEVTNTVSTTVSNTVTTEISGTVDTVVTAPVAISGTVDVAGDVGITGPVTVSGAVNITGGTVDADITGPVTIGGAVTVGGINTPVMVQGGGEILFAQSGSLAAGATLNFNIPAPTNGLQYYGLLVFFQGGGGNEHMRFSMANNGPGFAGGVSTVVLGSSAPANHLGTFGVRQRSNFIVPNAGPYPIPASIQNTSATTQSYTIQVNGIAQSLPLPVDAGEWVGPNDAAISFSSAAVNSVALIAPSFETRRFIFTTLTASAGVIRVESLSDASTPVWYTTQTNAFNQVYGGNVGTAALQANTSSEILIPGNGRPHRVFVATAITGTATLSYAGRV